MSGGPLPRAPTLSADRPRAVTTQRVGTVHGLRARGLMAVLWGSGLRVQEALDLTELDLDRRRGSVLVRRGKGGRRREVGMDDWGFEQLEPWPRAREQMPVGPLFCMINGRSGGRPWRVGRSSDAASSRSARGCPAALRPPIGYFAYRPLSCFARTCRSTSFSASSATATPA